MLGAMGPVAVNLLIDKLQWKLKPHLRKYEITWERAMQTIGLQSVKTLLVAFDDPKAFIQELMSVMNVSDMPVREADDALEAVLATAHAEQPQATAPPSTTPIRPQTPTAISPQKCYSNSVTELPQQSNT